MDPPTTQIPVGGGAERGGSDLTYGNIPPPERSSRQYQDRGLE